MLESCWPLSRRFRFRVDAANRLEGKAQVADLGEQAVQGRLIDDGPGDPGQAGLVAGDLEAIEPGRPAAVQHAPNTDLVEVGLALRSVISGWSAHPAAWIFELRSVREGVVVVWM